MKRSYTKSIKVPVRITVEIQVEYEQDIENPDFAFDCGVDMASRHVSIKSVAKIDPAAIREGAISEAIGALIIRGNELCMMPEVRKHAATEEIFKGYTSTMRIEHVDDFDGGEDSCSCDRCVTTTIMGYALKVEHVESGEVLGTLRCTAARAIPDMKVEARRLCDRDYSKRSKAHG